MTVTDANGCTDETTAVVSNLVEQFSVDIEVVSGSSVITKGDSVQLKLSLGIDETLVDTIIWSTKSFVSLDSIDSEITLAPAQSLNISVTVYDNFGCFSVAEIVIMVNDRENISLPNIININGNTENRYFYPKMDEEADIIVRSMLIFNRWGNLVFENNDFRPNSPTEGWDGLVNGKEVVSDTYIFRLVMQSIDGEIINMSGSITVIQ